MNLKEYSEKRITLLNTNLSKNLTMLMDREQITESELARSLNLPYNTIKRLINGVTTDPRVSTLSLITEYFNVGLDCLLNDNTFQKLPSKHTYDAPRSVPILGWEDISCKNFLETLNLKNWESWQPIALASTDNLSERAYALESRPSMQSRFPLGTIFVIDPKAKPMDGDLVLIRFKNNDSVSLRDLIIDSPHWQLSSITNNTTPIDYDVIEHEISGIVVFTILNARKS